MLVLCVPVHSVACINTSTTLTPICSVNETLCKVMAFKWWVIWCHTVLSFWDSGVICFQSSVILWFQSKQKAISLLNRKTRCIWSLMCWRKRVANLFKHKQYRRTLEIDMEKLKKSLVLSWNGVDGFVSRDLLWTRSWKRSHPDRLFMGCCL